MALSPEFEQREIERAGGVDLVVAPRDWTAARVEAWLDWGETLATDYPPPYFGAQLRRPRHSSD